MSNPDDLRDDVQDDEIIGRALWRSLTVIGVLVVLVGSFLLVRWWLQPGEAETVETEIALPKFRDVDEVQLPQLRMVDTTLAAGIDWRHVSGMEGEKLLPETMGGGIAVLDYDRDGDQDLLFVGGTAWEWAKNAPSNSRSLCLYQNDGTAHFTEVTAAAGLDLDFYGMGPVVGDYDNDGWPDLYVTAVGKNRLFHNQRGKFVELTDVSGTGGLENGWSSGAVWFDYDRDGLLDLFVCDYVVWSRELDLSLGSSLTGIGRAYGQPTLFTGTQSHLYHNEGEGKFVDVSQMMGIEISNPDTGVPVGKGLGVAAIDVNHDGWQDLVVANDTVRNFLFMNLEGKGFEEAGIPMGIALDRSGNATGAMGIDCCYLRNDDTLAIAIGNFANEQTSLYISRGPQTPFSDRAMTTGLGPMSRLNLTFGLIFADLDLDSRSDIVCANGHLEAEIAKVQATQQYAQPPQIFWNAGSQGTSEFVALTAEQLGPGVLEPMVGRGVACGDLDGDGDLDVVLVANSGLPRVLRNDQEQGNHWLRLSLEGGPDSNRDAVGATVIVRTGDDSLRQVVSSSRSYLSQGEHTLTFGLGKVNPMDAVEIYWPSGLVEQFEFSVDQEHRVKEGTGKPRPQLALP